MEVAIDRSRQFILHTLLLLLLCAAPSACRQKEVQMSPGPELQKAQTLANAWATSQGARSRELDAEGDLTLGDNGLRYVSSQRAIFGRVWVNMAPTNDQHPERMVTYKRMLAALNDPEIGGMFDQANGYFVLDEKSQGFYLVRKFDLSSATSDSFVTDMRRLQLVAERWTTKWFLDVAMIMHGKERAPQSMVLMGD